MGLLRIINSIMDRVCVIAGALIGVQIPTFIQQYKQRLAGHVAELNQVIEGLEKLALQSNKTLVDYIGKFMGSSDPDFSQQGLFMQTLTVRWEKLNEALANLMTSTLWDRPYIFLRDVQTDIAWATVKDFEPGITMTPEGFIYMGIGAAVGYGLYRLILASIRLVSGQHLQKLPLSQ